MILYSVDIMIDKCYTDCVVFDKPHEPKITEAATPLANPSEGSV